MKQFKSIVIVGILLFTVSYWGCDSMDDNYKQYMEEYNYSGKVDSLRVYPGFERVILAWDNPKDQKSKSIRILYGEDSTEIKYDTMVDSVSIEGLNAGTGYEFIVYTQDQFNNQFVTIMGTSNVLMSFSGNIEYSINGPDGFTISDQLYLPEAIGASQVDIPVSSLIPLPFLPVGVYSFEVKVSVFPIMGNLVSVDEVVLINEQTITVDPVVINLMNIPGTVSDKYNTGGGEGIEKLVDGVIDSKYLTGNQSTWMMWKMDREFIATYYTLRSANDAPERDPKNWILEGSNDGTNWTQLDEQNEVKFGSRFERKTFLIDNTTPYSHYRLNVSANNGSNLFQLDEWTLYYDSAQ